MPPAVPPVSTTARDLRRRMAVGAGFAAQGLGYASVMTSLPSFETRWGLDDMTVALVILGTCVAAALGSIIADRVAVRHGSRVAVSLALSIQAVAVLAAAFAPALAVFIAAVAVYGVGLGMMDASQNMQGVLLERTQSRHLMGRFYACYTTAAIIGALCMSAFLASSGAVTGALVVAAVVAILVALAGARWLDDTRVSRELPGVATHRPRLPGGRIVMVGLIVLGIYMLDSAVSTWATVYLQNGLMVTAAIAPLGYAAYQAAVLLMRLATDPLETRIGRGRLALIALALGVVGCVVVAAVPTAVGAIIGFAIAGLATGALVPVAFSAAGTLLPERSDEVIARVNLFNYGGAVAGGVILGVVATGPGLGLAFLIPGVALVLFAPLLRAVRQSRTVESAAV